jgi:hypothetical protein
VMTKLVPGDGVYTLTWGAPANLIP